MIGENMGEIMVLDSDGRVPAIRDFHKMAGLPMGCGSDTVLAKAAELFLCHGVKIGGVYRHWKGKEYKVTSVANDTDDWTRFRVHYVEVTNAEHTGDRLLDEFLGDMNDERYQGPRFTFVR